MEFNNILGFKFQKKAVEALLKWMDYGNSKRKQISIFATIYSMYET
jgi:hypothetical protein